MREACARTADGFAAVVGRPPARRSRRGRGERWVEGVFGLHARHVGNAVGYDTIAAAGDHACTLHWIRNDGDLRDGRPAPARRRRRARLPLHRRRDPDPAGLRHVQRAAAPRVRGGARGAGGRHRRRPAGRHVLRRAPRGHPRWSPSTSTRGACCRSPLEEALSEEGGQHRRWMPHGTSHHLGIDVHDCAQARRENYREGTLAPGHGDHGRARALLQVRRRAGAGGAARHRRPDRGRHPDHRRRQREPVRRAPPDRRRRRGLDGRRLGARLPAESAAAGTAGDRDDDRPQRRYLPGLTSLPRSRASPAGPGASRSPSSRTRELGRRLGLVRRRRAPAGREPDPGRPATRRTARASSGWGSRTPTTTTWRRCRRSSTCTRWPSRTRSHGHDRSKLEMFGDDLFMVDLDRRVRRPRGD